MMNKLKKMISAMKMNREPEVNHQMILEVDDVNCSCGHFDDTIDAATVLAAAVASVLMKSMTMDERVTVMTVVPLHDIN